MVDTTLLACKKRKILAEKLQKGAPQQPSSETWRKSGWRWFAPVV
jgi:hypothetical protein